MPRKQLEIEGTAPKRIQRLEDCAEAYRNIVLDRVEMQKKETEAKQTLLAEIQKQITAGRLVPHVDTDGEVVPVYRFDSDEGEIVIRYGKKEAVRVGKAKDEEAAV